MMSQTSRDQQKAQKMETTTLHNSSRKLPKLKSLTGTISPINTDSKLIRYLCSGVDDFSSPTITAKSSSGSNNNNYYDNNLNNENKSFIRKSSSSFSPLSSIENVMMMQSPSYRTPPPVMKVVDDDVLVMDGILLDSPVSSKGSKASSIRYLTSSSDYSSGESDGPSSFKMEFCRSLENFGHCRYGSKCQYHHLFSETNRPSTISLPRPYAHADVRRSSPTPAAAAPRNFNFNFNESEFPRLGASLTKTRNSDTVEISTSSFAGHEELSNKEIPKPIVTDEQLPEKGPTNDGTFPATTDKELPLESPTVDSIIPTLTDKEPSERSAGNDNTNPIGSDKELSGKSATVDIKHKDWSPLDDKIECVLPKDKATNSRSSREDVNAHINNVLYGPRSGKRKPGFPALEE